jgi:hypothetical protein
MTWTKLGAEFLTDPTMLSLPRGVRLLHIESMIWCNQHGTDGAVPRHMLARLSDEPDAEAAALMLVAAGRWEATAEGYQVLGFVGDQLSAAEVAELRDKAAVRQRRNRLHKSGDHTMCADPRYCSHVTRDATREPASDSAVSDETPYRSVPNRTVPSRSEGREVGEEGSGRGSAPLTVVPDGPPLGVRPSEGPDRAALFAKLGIDVQSKGSFDPFGDG